MTEKFRVQVLNQISAHGLRRLPWAEGVTLGALANGGTVTVQHDEAADKLTFGYS